MKNFQRLIMRLMSGAFTLLFPLSCMLFAQHWEVGGSGGYGLYRDVSVTAPSASGTTGFKSGIALGGVLGNDLYHLIGGEVRYTYRRDDLRVSAAGTKATASGDSQALHYDVLIHAAPKESVVRPFLAVGAGIKLFRGTGAEPAFQPLGNLVLLTHTNQAEPLVSVGGGVKIAVSHRVLVRFDCRDYITPYPDHLLALPGSSKAGGWMHDIVYLIGVSTVF